jgi:hypothetical protein
MPADLDRTPARPWAGVLAFPASANRLSRHASVYDRQLSVTGSEKTRRWWAGLRAPRSCSCTKGRGCPSSPTQGLFLREADRSRKAVAPSRSHILTSRRAAQRRDVGRPQSTSPRASIMVAMSCLCSSTAALNQASSGSRGIARIGGVSGHDNGEGHALPGQQGVDGASGGCWLIEDVERVPADVAGDNPGRAVETPSANVGNGSLSSLRGRWPATRFRRLSGGESRLVRGKEAPSGDDQLG